MTTAMALCKDVNGYVTFLTPVSNRLQSFALVAGVAQSYTLPSDALNYQIIVFVEPGATVWFSTVGTAAVPPSTTSFANTAGKTFTAGTVVSMITANSTATVGFEVYAV